MKNNLKFAFNNLFYKTNKKLIAIASDDWGSIRIKSKKDQVELTEKGLNIATNRFDAYDSLESNKDLEELYEVLLSFKDFKGNHPIITPAFNAANPDFEAIKENNFTNYVSENINKTILRYPASSQIIDLYKKGIEHNIFVPQSHGKEHIQATWWIKELQNKNSFAKQAFCNEFIFIPDNLLTLPVNNIQGTFNALNISDIEHYEATVSSTITMFTELFGYKPTYFTPPAMFYHKSLESILVKNGFKYLDVELVQKKSLAKNKTINFLAKNKTGLKAVIRNNVFETNLESHNDGVDSCLKNIELAFKYKQPAIISNHRVSFVGEIDEKNRANGLKALQKLLREILNKWPEAEFVSVPNLFN